MTRSVSCQSTVHFLTAGTALAAGATVALADGATTASVAPVALGAAEVATSADAEEATSPGLTSDALQPINAAEQQTITIVFFIVLSPMPILASLIISKKSRCIQKCFLSMN